MNSDPWKQLSLITSALNNSKDLYSHDEHKLKSGTFANNGSDSSLDNSNNFKVVIRIRPPLGREINPYAPFISAVNLYYK